MIEQLENNEQILLMYLADELPAEDRGEVEQMLASDASLRGELAKLVEAHEVVEAGLVQLDSLSRLPVTADAAARRINRLIATHFDRGEPALQEPEAEKTPLPYPWWAYPVAAAAAILLALSAVWWHAHAAGPDAQRNIVREIEYHQSMPEVTPEERWLAQSFDTPSADTDSSIARGPDEDLQAVAVFDGRDGMPQDEIGQFMLSEP